MEKPSLDNFYAWHDYIVKQCVEPNDNRIRRTTVAHTARNLWAVTHVLVPQAFACNYYLPIRYKQRGI